MRQHYLGRTRGAGVRVVLGVSLFAIAGCGMNVPITEDGTAGAIGRSRDDRTPNPDNKTACDRCGGLWGIHGIASIESCICRANDGGRSCTSGSDCEGACIVADDAAFEVVEQGDPPLGVFVGRCADYVTTFGCYRVAPPLEDGTPALLPEDQAAQDICVD